MSRPVFIAGVHRSGTSTLHDVLRSHPQLYGLVETGKPMDEGQHCQSLYPTDEVFGGPGRFAFAPEAAMDERHSLVSLDNARQLWATWHKYTIRDGEFFVEKSPPNIVRTRFLQALFPDARQIVVLRHPIITAFATVKRWPLAWNGNWMPYAENALLAYERFTKDRSSLTNVLVIRYEDLLARESLIMRTIWSFLRIAPVDGTAYRPERNELYNLAWDASMAVLPDGGEGIRQWIGIHWGKRLAKFGYSCHDLREVTPIDWIAGS